MVHPQSMYQSLLVPFDGSPLSASAVPVAAALARHTGATIHLALVFDPSAYIPFVPGEVAVPVYDAELVQEHRAQDQALLDAAVSELQAQDIKAHGVLLEGTIIEALCEQARACRADLTVMTTHGRRGFQRFRLGSVAADYLTRATEPVLMVRGAGSDAVPELPTGPLLCPLDGSPFAETILPHARQFAEAAGMTMALTAVSVPRAMPMAPFGAEALLADTGALEAQEEGREGYLRRIAATLPAGTTANAVTDMAVGRALNEEAARLNAGAIALSTHGRGGIKRFLFGSVADELLRHATVPLLVYRPDSK